MNDKALYEEAYLQKTTKALKGAITEGRQLLQDMKAERRAFEKLLADVRKETKESVENHIEAQVKVGLAEYRKAMDDAIKKATAAVFKRFDTLADIMMGTDDPTKESLATLVRRWKANRD